MHPVGQLANLFGGFCERLFIRLVNGKLQKDPRFLKILFQRVKGLDPVA